mgnify:FL=1
MQKSEISEIAEELRKTYGIVSPQKLCEYLGIGLAYMNLGTGSDCIKGLSRTDCRCSSIIINENLNEKQTAFTIYHEIGHILLGHTVKSTCACMSVFSRDETLNLEVEANEFVAEYLMDTEETLQVLKETDSFFEAASVMRVPPVIMDFKWRMLKARGLVTVDAPIYSRRECIKYDLFNGLDVDYFDF